MVDRKNTDNRSNMKQGAEKWMWCKRCQRCYLDGEFRIMKGINLCPYNNCLGLIEIDGWPWSRILKIAPDYPEIPERNIIYPDVLSEG